MHSSAKSPGLPGESQDKRLAHIQKGFVGWICYQHTQIQKSHLHRGTNKYAVRHIHVCTLLLRLQSASLFCQSGWFFSCDPQQGFSISWKGNTHMLVKHNWLIYLVSGPEVGGILDAPWRSHGEIIQRGQRAWSGNNRGDSLLSWVQLTMSFFQEVLCFVSSVKCLLPGVLVFSFHYTWLTI